MHSLPYWRLSGFYFFHFAVIGAFVPYWTLYLQSLSFSALQIGILMSLLLVTRIFAPAVWGWLADHTGRRMMVVQFAALGGFVSFIGFFFGQSFAWIFMAMLLMSFCWSAALPLIEAVTLSHLRDKTDRYGQIRSWGSVGFILAVVGVGYLLDRVGIIWLLWVVLVLKLGILVFSRSVPESEVIGERVDQESMRQLCQRPEVLAFLFSSLLMIFAHGVYYTFFSIYLVEHGYDKGFVGWLWAIGVICEIGVFFLMPWMMRRFSLKIILMFSFACAVLRFLMIGWGVEWVAVIVCAQVLHAATYGAHHVAAMMLVHRFFQGRHQAKGQTIYTSVSYGLGGTLGAILSGSAWDNLGAETTFTISAVSALLGMILVAWKVKMIKCQG